MKLKKIISAAVGVVVICSSLPISGAEVGFMEDTLKANAADEATTWVVTDASRSWEETTSTEVTTTATEITTTATKNTKLGDVNGDGVINSKDSVIVLKAYAETLAGAVGVLKQEEAFRADLNGDNCYDTKDAVIILKKYAERLISDGSNNISNDSAKTSITMELVVNSANNTVDIPVKISGNAGFAGGGIVFNYDPKYDSKLSFDGIKNGIVGNLVTYVDNNSVAVTFASGKNIISDGVMFTLQFKLPDDAKQGGAFWIGGSIDTFCNSDAEDVFVKCVGGFAFGFNHIKTTTKPTTNTTTTTTTKSLGDLNGDKNIDSKDAVLVLKSYAKSLASGGNGSVTIEQGDVNKDGKVDSKDAVLILRYYASKLAGTFDGNITEFK